ncbi:MAG: queuosine precursor transporter [Planctomycetes bacterium]|nr:queuosine precursor transporter [Planctomycetota bacterium]
MVCMNVLGITRFIRIGGWEFTAFGQKLTVLDLAIGVLPYPVTFLATDIISELYGRRRASFVVWVGFLLNVFLLLVCWLGQLFPAPFDAHGALWKQAWVDMGGSGVPSTLPPPDRFYGQVWLLMSGATAASMVAYLAAQLVDVHLFHYWKRVTKGKHLWLRNNGSTLVSQLVDSIAVLTITLYSQLSVFGGDKPVLWLITLIVGSYLFKVIAALLDTPLFYLAAIYLRPLVTPPKPDPSEAPAPAD